MGERESYAPGTFCWADLGTTDADAAKSFYTTVFGWEAEDAPAGDAGTYTTFRLDGRDVAALYEMGEEERSSLTPHWSSYVAVEDVDALAPRVLELGGEVLAHPFDVMTAGRMTALRDPTGATVHLWQAARAGRRRPRQRRRLHGLERARHARPRPRARLLRRAARLDRRARGVRLRRDQVRRRSSTAASARRRTASPPTGSSTSPPRRSTTRSRRSRGRRLAA